MNLQITEHKFSRFYNRDMSLSGAFPESDFLRLSLNVSRYYGAVKAELQIHADALDFPEDKELCFPMLWSGTEGSSDIYRLDISLTDLCDKPGKRLFYYRYKIAGIDGELSLGGEEPTELLPCSEFGDRQLLVFDDDYKTSSHLTEGIIYHIFVDRFYRSGKCAAKGDAFINEDWDNGIPQYGPYPGAPLKNNMFFGGDLYGIAEKLPYIASLGTKTIYLSPVFESASNHKYDTGDYLKIDSMFGGEKALKFLIEEAEKYSIRIILDGVFNHTGSDSVYFNREGNYESIGAYNSEKSDYYNWYSFDKFPDKYECWWNVDILPRVDSGNKDYNDFMFGKVIPKWMKLGIGGWRLDVADELNNTFLKTLRKTVKSYDGDAPIIGEVWEDATNKIAYGKRRDYFMGRELDSVMNYPLREAVIDYVKHGNAEKLRTVSAGFYRRCPKQSSDNMMNFLSTHDTQRILTVLGGEEQGEHTNAELSVMKMNPEERKNAVKMLKLAYSLIAAMPGVPCVFYGDEAGLEGYRDPFCRRPFPWNNIEPELLRFYRKIGAIRKEEKLFSSGTFKNIYCTESIYAFLRMPWNGEGCCILTVCNRSENAITLKFSSIVDELIENQSDIAIKTAPFSTAYIKMPVNEAEKIIFE